MPAAPVAVIDALNSLLETESSSIFRFMGEGSPYLSRAAAEIRRPLNQMVQAGERRQTEIARMIDRLGGFPSPRSIQFEEQYLAFLSLKFLLPKLANAKRLSIELYENMLNALSAAPREVTQLLQSHLQEMNAELQSLEKASADLLVKK